MPDEDSLKTAKDGVSLVTEIMKAAGDNPNVKEAASNLGQTAVTLTKTINNVLLPIAAINFAFDKAREYFAGRFQQDLAEKAAAIPPEHIVEPKASVAGPSLQGLAFTHEEPSLKDMYLNLLATAMDGRVAADAHPAFVEIIKQLNADEADLMQGALRSPSAIPIVQLHARLNDNKGYKVLRRHVLHLRNTTTEAAIENPRLPAMIDNWIRLGLVEVAYDKHLADPGLYTWVEQRPEFLRLQEEHNNDGQTVEFEKGIIERTELGKQFSKAIGLSAQ